MLKIWLPLTSKITSGEGVLNQGLEFSSFSNTDVTLNTTSGPLGANAVFNGTSSWLRGSYTCAEAELSICMWAYFDKLNVHLVDMRNSDGSGYQPYYVGSSGIQVGGSNSSYVYINFVPTLSTWYHLCIVYTPSKVILYVNGEYYGETTSAKAANFNKKIDISIGSRYTGANWFGGRIADFRLYNNALTPYEVREISRGLLLHYTRPTDSISAGATIVDSSGFGRNGVLNDAIFAMDSTNIRRYYNWWDTYNANGYITAASPSYMTKAISFWISTPKTASTVFFADYRSCLAFGFNASGYIIPCCTGYQSYSKQMFASTKITANAYTHIVIQKTSDNSDIELYIDGEKETTRYSTNYWTHSSDTLMIGKRSTGTPMNNTGFCDFRMYAMRLTDDEILDLYHTSLKLFDNGKASPFELYENTVGKVQVAKSGRLISNEFIESNVNNKFKSTQVISNEFRER